MRVKTIRKGFYDKPPYNKPIDIKGGFFYNKKRCGSKSVHLINFKD
jgi:hypothetical protein